MEDSTLNIVFEHLFLSQFDRRVIFAALSTLPLPKKLSPRVLQAFLIRSLTLYALSDKTLTSIELLYKFYRNSVSLRRAYCAIAVYLTVWSLKNEGDRKFVEVVELLWRRRIEDLEKGEDRGLVSDELMRNRTIMEEAVDCESKREELMRMDVSKMVVDAVEIFVKEALEGLGHSAFEVATNFCRQLEVATTSELPPLTEVPQSDDGPVNPDVGI